jgi:hypothetical protein
LCLVSFFFACSLGIRKLFRISYLLFMPTGFLLGFIVTIIVSLATGGYPEDQMDSSLVHGWSIKLFSCFRRSTLPAGRSTVRLVASASSYDVEMREPGMMTAAASKATLVTTIGSYHSFKQI